MNSYYRAACLASLLFLFSDSIMAQTSFWKKLSIRKAFETKTDDDNSPATVSFTLPKDTAASFLINAGLGYNFSTATRHTKSHKLFKNSFDGYFVYNQNTLIDKAQHNYKLGITSVQLFEAARGFSIFGNHTLTYLHDYTDTSHSILITSYWHPVLRKQGQVHLGGYTPVDGLVNYYIPVELGLEYQNALEANSTAKKGNVGRGYFRTGLNLMLKKKPARDTSVPEIKQRFWPKGIEAFLSYTGRNQFFSTIPGSENYIPLFKAEIDFYPFKDDNVSLGFSYNSGADPVNAVAKQTFWLFTLNYKK